MPTFTDIRSARQRLKEAQDATAKFIAEHKGGKWSNEDAAKRLSLITAELNASIHLTDLQIGPNKRRSAK